MFYALGACNPYLEPHRHLQLRQGSLLFDILGYLGVCHIGTNSVSCLRGNRCLHGQTLHIRLCTLLSLRGWGNPCCPASAGSFLCT